MNRAGCSARIRRCRRRSRCAVGAHFQEALDALLRQHTGTPSESPGGITAAVIAPGCGTWAGASGQRIDAEPMTSDTQLLIASITKSVTAAAVLRLVEEGLVDLDAPIADYLPADLHVDTNGATVRQVLRMRSHRGGRRIGWTRACSPRRRRHRPRGSLATLPPPIAQRTPTSRDATTSCSATSSSRPAG
jgi:CubicO group peptidase (beta-lactamase class C family)